MSRFTVFIWAVLAFLPVSLRFCDETPDIDYGKLSSNYFVYCCLYPEVASDTITQNVYIFRMESLIELGFKPRVDFGVEGAEVKITHDDSVFRFMDIGCGVYRYINTGDNPFVRGKKYKLDVLFPDGTRAYSETIIPYIELEERDTLYILPDSVVRWYTFSWGQTEPDEIAYTGQADSIRFRIPDDCNLNIDLNPQTWEIGKHKVFLYAIARTGYICVSAACDSPSVVESLRGYVEVDVYVYLRSMYEEYANDMGTDDFWPIEDIEEKSNVRGAYGLFFGRGLWGHLPVKHFVIALGGK